MGRGQGEGTECAGTVLAQQTPLLDPQCGNGVVVPAPLEYSEVRGAERPGIGRKAQPIFRNREEGALWTGSWRACRAVKVHLDCGVRIGFSWNRTAVTRRLTVVGGVVSMTAMPRLEFQGS